MGQHTAADCVEVMFLSRRSEGNRPGSVARGLEDEHLQTAHRRQVGEVLYKDAEEIVGSRVIGITEPFHWVLCSGLEVFTPNDDSLGAVPHQKKVVVVRGGADRVAPIQENVHGGTVRKKDGIELHGTQAENVRRVCRRLEKMKHSREPCK